MLTFLVGFIIDLELAVEWLHGKNFDQQPPAIHRGIVLIIVGVQFVSIGLLGEMITRTNVNEEYVIKEKVLFN